jgi:hypothetical protein
VRFDGQTAGWTGGKHSGQSLPDTSLIDFHNRRGTNLAWSLGGVAEVGDQDGGICPDEQ